jgi:hypothetical protein
MTDTANKSLVPTWNKAGLILAKLYAGRHASVVMHIIIMTALNVRAIECSFQRQLYF